MKKVGRNEPCPCGSGKKFKKCCESKMLGGRFMATKIEPADTLSKKVSGLTGFFQSKISEIAKPTDATKPIKPSSETPPSSEDPNKEIEP